MFDPDELALVRSSLRHAIRSNTTDGVVGGLLDQGWNDLVDADPATAITVLAEECGAARSTAAAADLAVLWGAGLTADASTAVLHDGLVLAGASHASRFVWLTDDSVRAVPADSVTLTPAGGLDPALGAQRATVTGTGEVVAGAAAAERALAAGRRALASHLIGAADQMLADTVDYVTERRQYGRPIGSFQAVKHRLADVKVATTAGRAAATAAWELHAESAGSTLAIAAKCLGGRAHAAAATQCFQVHGGIAFTAEHGFQQWVRRGLVLDTLLGGHAQLTAELGRRLIATGAVPRLPDFRAEP